LAEASSRAAACRRGKHGCRRTHSGQATALLALILALTLLALLTLNVAVNNQRSYALSQTEYSARQEEELAHQAIQAYLQINVNTGGAKQGNGNGNGGNPPGQQGKSTLNEELYVTDTGTLPVQIAYILEAGQPRGGGPGAGGSQGAAQVRAIPPTNPIIQPGQTVQEQIDQGYYAYVVVTTLGLAVQASCGLGGGCLEYAYGNQGYISTYTAWGEQVQAFPDPSPLTCLYGGAGAVGYTATAEVVFAAPDPNITVQTDDGAQVFIRNLTGDTAGGWIPLLPKQAWNGGPLKSYTATLSVTPGLPYEVAVDWYANSCVAQAESSIILTATASTPPAWSVLLWAKTGGGGKPSQDTVTQAPDNPEAWGSVVVWGSTSWPV